MIKDSASTVITDFLNADMTYQQYFGGFSPAYFEQFGLSNPLVPSNLSIRLEAALKTAGIAGDIVQCGVYRGSSLGTLALLLKATHSAKRLWGADSFQGFPGSSEFDLVGGILPKKAHPDYFADTSLATVQNLLENIRVAEQVSLWPGFYDDSLPRLPASPISLLILDCDLYESYRTALTTLYSRLSPGGIVIFDEYFSPKYPGARRAVDEFFADKKEKPLLATAYLQFNSYERWYVIKA